MTLDFLYYRVYFKEKNRLTR